MGRRVWQLSPTKEEVKQRMTGPSGQLNVEDGEENMRM